MMRAALIVGGILAGVGVAGADVTVESEPAGAEVTINGKLVGKTPLALKPLGKGEHVLKVVMTGYDVAEYKLAGKEAEESGIRIQLKKNGERARVVVTQTKIEIFERLSFASGKPEVPAAGHKTLDAIAATLAGNPQVTVDVIGHADKTEKDADVLGLARANLVIAYIAAKGVDARRMTAKSEGAKQPIDAGKSAAALAKNRRVEFRITSNP